MASNPFRDPLARLRSRLQARGDTEHEQALIRIVVNFAMYFYLLAIPHAEGHHAQIVFWVTVVFLADLVLGVGILLHIVRHPAINPRRRVLAILVDTVAINATILVGGTSASALYPLLLWIILGHGFRYGRRYLWLAALLSVALFSLVVALSPEWRAIPALALALILDPPGQRQRKGEDLGEFRSGGDLAGDVADHPPEHGAQAPQRLGGPPELLGMSIALVLDEGALTHPRIGLT